MKVVLAPDSFKESMSAQQVAENLQAGLQIALPDAEFVCVPMADGGEGTARSLIDATGGRAVTTEVLDPLGRSIDARFGVLGGGGTAVLETAAASGLELLGPDERDPMRTSTYGTGQLLRAAADEDVETVLIGIGGSGTNDGGAGMLQALGGRLLDGAGRELPRGGGALKDLRHLDLSGVPERVRGLNIVVACDVDNPLTGPTGAAHIFGPQKGATPAMIEELDAGLANLAAVIRSDLGLEVENVPGAGAAGGLGAGLMAFLGATLQRGIDIVIEHTGLEEHIAGADLVITGEGSIDQQTRFGKTPYGVARIAKKHGLPVIAIAGKVDHDARVLHEHGIDAIVPILHRPCTLAEALAEGPDNVRRTGETLGRMLLLGGLFPHS